MLNNVYLRSIYENEISNAMLESKSSNRTIAMMKTNGLNSIREGYFFSILFFAVVLCMIGLPSTSFAGNRTLAAFNIAKTDSTQDIKEKQITTLSSSSDLIPKGAVVSTVTSKEIERDYRFDPLYSLIGRVSGVSMGSGNNLDKKGIFIRGVHSYRFTNPLYLIDGFEGDLHMINPLDIENVEVLKDGAATAIYGYRGGNGVIRITTKQGSRDKMRIRFTSWMGKSEATYDNPLTTNSLRWQKIRDLNETSYYYFGNDKVENRNSDAFDAFRRTGFEQNYHLNIQGGNQKVEYYVAGAFTSNEETIDPNNFKKYSAMAHLKFNLGSLTIEPRVSYVNKKREKGSLQLRHIVYFTPTMDLDCFDPLKVPNSLEQEHWDTGLNMQYLLTEGLSLHLDQRYADYQDIDKKRYWETLNHSSIGTKTENHKQMYHLNAYVDYQQKLSLLDFALQAGFQYQTDKLTKEIGDYDKERYLREHEDLARYIAENPSYQWGIEPFSQERKYSVRSPYAHLSLGLDSKLEIEGTVRYDKIGSITKTSYALSGGWNVANHDFFKENLSWIDELTIRASYGKMGMADILYLPRTKEMNYFYDVIDQESITKKNIGGHLSIAQGLLFGGLNLYDHRITSSTDTYPYDAPQDVKMKNSGWELELGSQWKGRGFSYHFTGFISHNENEICNDLNSQMAGQRHLGFTPSCGDISSLRLMPGLDHTYVDVNRDGIIRDFDDNLQIGNFFPELEYGVSLSMSYKRLDFSLLLNGKHNKYLLNNLKYGPSKFSVFNETRNFWDDLTMINKDHIPGDYVEDASFLSLRNIQLGYTLSSDILQGSFIQSIRLFVSAKDLVTYTDYDGFDPDQWIVNNKPIEMGYTNNRYSNLLGDYLFDGFYLPSKTILVGVQISF